MCAKVISISYTCWAIYNNQKTIPGQEVHKFYPFQTLFLAYWGFQKYSGPTAECFSPPEPLTRGSAPGPRWGLCPRPPL